MNSSELITLVDFSSFCLALNHGQAQLIDVRAPVEFIEGSIPHSLNSPILNDEERTIVGTIYKQKGPAAAVEAGHQLVSGVIKENRVQAWQSLIQKNSFTVITCFRGGLRSKLTQDWLADVGFKVPRIQGGYKALRQFLRNEIDQFIGQTQFLVITGATGSAKTRLLRALKNQRPLLDLELAANHRGSAFGGYQTPQPSQVNFENNLSFQILELKQKGQFSPEDF